MLLTLSPSISLGKIQRTGLTVTLQGICEFIHLSYVVIVRRALVGVKNKGKLSDKVVELLARSEARKGLNGVI